MNRPSDVKTHPSSGWLPLDSPRFDIQPGRPQGLLWILLVAAIYFLAARLGLSLAFLHASVSPLWPPTGVAIAAVVLLGGRISPGIFLGAFLVNFATPVSAFVAIGIAAGNTLEAVAAGWLIKRFIGTESPFERARDILKFIVLASLISTAISATIGNVTLCLGHAADWKEFDALWLTWWLGDGAGALLVAPLLITWFSPPKPRVSPRLLVEGMLLIATLSLVASIVFGAVPLFKAARYPIEHLTVPFLLWAAFRFGPRGSASANIVLSAIATWCTTRGLGPFVADSPNESLLLLELFLAAAGITSLILGAVVCEHQRAKANVTHLASIVESTNDSVIGKTADGIILSWNTGAERLYGYKAGEVIGRSIAILIPPARDDLDAILEKVSRGEQVEHYETERVRKDGVLINVALTVSPIRESSGAIVGASTIARDITGQKRAEEALKHREEQLRLALDAAKMGTWDYDLASGTVSWSSSLETIHGIEPGSFGGTFDDYLRDIHPDDLGHVKQALARAILQGEEHRIEYRIIRPDGAVRWVEGRGQVIRNSAGNVVRMTGVCVDITDRKDVESAREQLLAREQDAREGAEAANRAKDEFLALVSHELRTPLNAIVGWVNILLSESKADDGRQHRGLEVIRRNAELQRRIVEDILDVSSIMAGKLQIEKRSVALTPVVQAAISASQPAAEKKGVQLRHVLDPAVGMVSADPGRLQQVVWNLVSNAIKFTPTGGSVEVTLLRDGDTARIAVRDTGEGISPEFLPRVFDRFSQADSSITRRHGGLGLGLAIVRNLVELHGGTVEAHSDGENRGSNFVVTIPCPEELVILQAGDSNTGVSERASLKDLNILVVDDDIDSREVISTALSLHGAEVRTAASVLEALMTLNEWKPGLLLSDIGMPGQDGYDLIRQVRESGAEYSRIPAIAVTGYADFREAERALAAGYQMHLPKPIEPVALVEIVTNLARAHGQIYAVEKE